MTKLVGVSDKDLAAVLSTLSAESDRGAALVVGSLLDNAMGRFFFDLCKLNAGREVAEKLTGATGPLTTFNQRIVIAHAFNYVRREAYRNLQAIRDVRNHFAHHPLSANFNDSEIVKAVERIRFVGDEALFSFAFGDGVRPRYVTACLIYHGQFEHARELLSKPDGAG